MYDIIGDIHGHASALKKLLGKLGYQERNGVWRHPKRKALFLGDYVDRGPEQVETVRVVRAMVEAGEALAIMGNHEFNAVAFATPDPQYPGARLRVHSNKNRRQHQAFLDQVGEESSLHADMVEWFKTLPLYLDLPELRAVHASWHPTYIDILAGYLDPQQRLLPDAWETACRDDHAAFDAIETLLKGLEIALPGNAEFDDKDGHRRRNIRVKWWHGESAPYRDLAMVPDSVRPQLPTELIPGHHLPGYQSCKPVFVGHYWLTGEPAPLTDKVACLDYSIAGGPGGKLVAYRWNGDSILNPARFVWVTEPGL